MGRLQAWNRKRDVQGQCGRCHVPKRTTQHLFRLVGIGLSNFQPEDDCTSNTLLLDEWMPVSTWLETAR